MPLRAVLFVACMGVAAGTMLNIDGNATKDIDLEPGGTSHKARSSLFADKQPIVYAMPATQETTRTGDVVVSYGQPQSTGTIQVMVPTPSPASDSAAQTAQPPIIIVPKIASTAEVSTKQASGPATVAFQPSNIVIGSPGAGGELTGSQQIMLSAPAANNGNMQGSSNIVDTAIPVALPAAPQFNPNYQQQQNNIVIDPIPGSMPDNIENLGRFGSYAGSGPGLPIPSPYAGMGFGLPLSTAPNDMPTATFMPDWTPDWLKPKHGNSFMPSGMPFAPNNAFMPDAGSGNVIPGMMPVPSPGVMPAPSPYQIPPGPSDVFMPMPTAGGPVMMPTSNAVIPNVGGPVMMPNSNAVMPNAGVGNSPGYIRMPNMIVSAPTSMNNAMARGMSPGGMVGTYPTISGQTSGWIPPPHAFGGSDMMDGMMPGMDGGKGKKLLRALRGLAGQFPQTHMSSTAEEEDGASGSEEEDDSMSDSDSSSDEAWPTHLRDSIDKLSRMMGVGPPGTKKRPLDGMDWGQARKIIGEIGPKLIMGDAEAKRKRQEAKVQNYHVH